MPTSSTAGLRAALPSKELGTVLAGTAALFLLSWILVPSSVAPFTLRGMLPFAAILAVVGLGQTLVVQQGGFDLSVPGAVSLAVVISTHRPAGNDDLLLGALGIVVLVALATGLLNGFIVSRIGLNPIVATLGTNALLYAGVLWTSGGTPRQTTDLLADTMGGRILGMPTTLVMAVALVVVVTLLMKRTVAGRRFEAVGASAPTALTAGLWVEGHRASAYLWAQLLYAAAGVMLAGILTQPTAFQGDRYLLPSVAVVVLGGTSLRGGRGFLTATAIAALFLTQLQQFVLALGVSFAVRTLVEAGALAVGVALYTVDTEALRLRFRALRAAQ